MTFPRTVLSLAVAALMGASPTALALAQDAPQPTAPVAPAAPPPDVSGQQGEAVAAVINDDIISTYDLRQRMLLLMLEARVRPTQSQLPAIQRAALKAAGCRVIRAEKASGSRRDGRTELQVLLDFVQPGDTLVVTRIDRLARSLKDLQDVDPPASTTGGRENVRRNEADAFALIPITRRFSAIANAVVDLTSDTWRRGELGIRYQDECTLLDIVYERENTFNRTLGPSDSIRVRLTLATLGDIQER